MFGTHFLEIILVGKLFFAEEFYQVEHCWVSQQGSELEEDSTWQAKAAVKDLSPKVGSYYIVSTYHYLAVLTETSFQTSLSLFVLSYEMGILGRKKGTGLKMLP